MRFIWTLTIETDGDDKPTVGRVIVAALVGIAIAVVVIARALGQSW